MLQQLSVNTKIIKKAFHESMFRSLKIRRGKFSFCAEVVLFLPMMKHEKLINGQIVRLTRKEIDMLPFLAHCTDACPACERNTYAREVALQSVNKIMAEHKECDRKIVAFLKELSE